MTSYDTRKAARAAANYHKAMQKLGRGWRVDYRHDCGGWSWCFRFGEYLVVYPSPRRMGEGIASFDAFLRREGIADFSGHGTSVQLAIVRVTGCARARMHRCHEYLDSVEGARR